jgi:hypothetical protein
MEGEPHLLVVGMCVLNESLFNRLCQSQNISMKSTSSQNGFVRADVSQYEQSENLQLKQLWAFASVNGIALAQTSIRSNHGKIFSSDSDDSSKL